MRNHTRDAHTLLAVVAGLGLVCGVAFAAKLQPSNTAGALTFDPFKPTRTTTSGTATVAPQPADSSTPSPALSGPTIGEPSGPKPVLIGPSDGPESPPRPPTRDPFRPPTRSPFIP